MAAFQKLEIARALFGELHALKNGAVRTEVCHINLSDLEPCHVHLPLSQLVCVLANEDGIDEDFGWIGARAFTRKILQEHWGDQPSIVVEDDDPAAVHTRGQLVQIRIVRTRSRGALLHFDDFAILALKALLYWSHVHGQNVPDSFVCLLSN